MVILEISHSNADHLFHLKYKPDLYECKKCSKEGK